ncbi:MAG: Bug family tripartite tricarboxylate transporter substrate binding protein [Hyphomicrobiaceae bacterium]
MIRRSNAFRRQAIAGLSLLVGLALAGEAAQAQGKVWPKQPVKLIVGFGAGGGNDLISRVIAQKLSERIGQPVVVENKPGAGGIIAAELVVRSPPDGHTLLVAPTGTLVGNPAVRRKLSYDPLKDFQTVVIVADYPLYLTVNGASPIKTVKDLVAYGKANPKVSNYASTSPVFQVPTELFKAKSGMPAEYIPFKSSNEMISAVLTKQVTFAFIDPSALMGHIKAGRLRAIATSGAKRSADLPNVPTMAEAGVPGVVVDGMTTLVAPAGTPMPVVKRIEAEVNAVLKMDDVKARFQQLAVIPVGGTSEEFSKRLVAELKVWKEVAKNANLYVD